MVFMLMLLFLKQSYSPEYENQRPFAKQTDEVAFVPLPEAELYLCVGRATARTAESPSPVHAQ